MLKNLCQPSASSVPHQADRADVESSPAVHGTLAEVADLVSWRRQFRLHNGATVVQLDPLTVETSDESWSYALEIPLDECGLAASPPPVLGVILEVLQGVVGIGLLCSTERGNEFGHEQSVRPLHGSVRVILRCAPETVSLMFRNASTTGQASVVRIHAVAPVDQPRPTTIERGSSALEKLRLRLDGFHHFGTPFTCEDADLALLSEASLRDVVLDAAELSQLSIGHHPDLSRLSFYRAMLETLLPAAEAPQSCRVVSENAATLEPLLHGSRSVAARCTDVRQLSGSLLRHAWPEFVAEHVRDDFDALACVNATASALLVRRAELLTELTGLPRKYVLLTVHVAPESLAAEGPVELPLRYRNHRTLLADALVRERLHAAAFFDVASVAIFVDGVPHVAPPSVSRAGNGGYAYLNWSPIATGTAECCEVWYLGSRRPLPLPAETDVTHALCRGPVKGNA